MNKQKLLECNQKELEDIFKRYVKETDYGFEILLDSRHCLPSSVNSRTYKTIKEKVMLLKTVRKNVFVLADKGRFYNLILNLLGDKKEVDKLFYTFWIWVIEKDGKSQIRMMVTSECFNEIYHSLKIILNESVDRFLKNNSNSDNN